jgi:23S rRNA pseudouridine1911/1915/1917 synthase
MGIREIRNTLVVEDLEKKTRVDAYIASFIQELSRTQIGSKDAIILVNGKKVKNSSKVVNGDTIEFSYDLKEFTTLTPYDIPLSVIYEDKDIIVINKDQGLIVHPGAGNFDETLVNALVNHLGDGYPAAFDAELNEEVAEENLSVEPAIVANDGEEEDEDEESEEVEPSVSSFALDPKRPGIVHRLDKDTSGTMVVALNKDSYYNLVEQFKERTTKKSYIAIVKGHFTKRRGRIYTNITRDPKDRKKFITCSDNEGKNADTTFVVLKQYEGFALLRVNIHTGRTHQIRVHLASINHPVLGDPIYSNTSKKFKNATLMLHAIKLDIEHPVTGETMTFSSPMPQRFKDILKGLPSFEMEKGFEDKYYESATKMASHKK